MRKLGLSIAAVTLMVPGMAIACHSGQASTMSVSCEQGVKVYRGTPASAPMMPIYVQKKSKSSILKQRLALQNERLAAQSERIDTLQAQFKANEPRPRSRYGRIYSAPVGAFGPSRFVRRRGFNNRRSSGIKVRYNRGRF